VLYENAKKTRKIATRRCQKPLFYRRYLNWSGRRESNPRMQLGKLRNDAVSDVIHFASKIIVLLPDQLGNAFGLPGKTPGSDMASFAWLLSDPNSQRSASKKTVHGTCRAETSGNRASTSI
jgi:hypothetical protein